MKFRSKQAEMLYNLKQQQQIKLEKQRGTYREPAPPEPARPTGIGPNGKLLPGYKYVKGGKVVKVEKKAGA